MQIEARSRIADREVNLAVGRPQLHVDMRDAAVFRGIVQGFLQHAEEAEGSIGRQLARDVAADEGNGDLLLRGEFLTERLRGSLDSQQLEPRRVQLVRQRLDVGPDLDDLPLQPGGLGLLNLVGRALR